MSLPFNSNALPPGAKEQIEDAIRGGGLTPPSQNFAGPLICAIALGCAALCEAIEGTLLVCAVCVVVGGICYTLQQLLQEEAKAVAAYLAFLKFCEANPKALDCNFNDPESKLRKLWDAMRLWNGRVDNARRGGSRPSTGSSTSNPGGSPSNKPQM